MRHAALLPLLLLAACGGSKDTPGGVTAGENKALDEAAEMLDQRQLGPGVIPAVPQGKPPTQTPATGENPSEAG